MRGVKSINPKRYCLSKMAQDYEKIVMRGITFQFKNNPKYIEQTERIKKWFKELLPALENYLAGMQITEKRKEQLEKSENYVFCWLMSLRKTQSPNTSGVLFFEAEEEKLVIELHPLKQKEQYKHIEDYMLIRTLIHEIFHLFSETEEETRNRQQDFMDNKGVVERFKSI